MIRGTKRALEKRPSIKANINASIHNRFDIEVVDAKTGEVKQKAQAENVVCDYLWTQMFKKSTSDSTKWFQTILVGDGTGTPSASDTTLFHYLASYTPAASDDVYRFDKKGHVASITRKVTILETQLVGNELTEVGISNATSSTCTHAMLTVTDSELLAKTGGIVQGMSGSPIIQNGKLVGAVTHVFVNEPNKGYAVSIQDMLRAAGIEDKAA